MAISANYLPSDLHYIIPLAQKHGMDARVAQYDRSLGRHVQHGPAINSWHDSQTGTCPPETTWPVYGLLCLFRQRGALNIAPFNNGVIGPMDGSGPAKRHMNPANLPETLRPFIPLFEKWGDVGDDLTRLELIRQALDDPAQMAELKEWHLRN